MTTAYLNFDGKVMAASAAPQHWLLTTYQNETLTAPAGATQFGDQLGGSPTFVGGGGDDTYYVLSPTTKIVEATSTGVNTINSWTSFVMPANVQNLYLQVAEATVVANSTGDLLVALFATNLFDTKYFESYLDKSLLTTAGFPPPLSHNLGIQGDRRRVGVRASYKF